ncbi:MAG: hypothetical protein HZA29_03465 [Candidatus Omnitrophica bacterium]|nr:hypothetical protein [Candidatus Omnitrophota bacterium]
MKIRDGFLGEAIQLTGPNITIKLPVPARGVNFVEPRSEGVPIFGGQTQCRLLNFSYLDHSNSLLYFIFENIISKNTADATLLSEIVWVFGGELLIPLKGI